MQLSPHFTLEELIASDTAARAGIDNYPTATAYENLKMLAASLEQVRTLLGFPIHINSGYRCQRLNSLVGGQKVSAHIDGLAADIICPQFGTPLEISKAIAGSQILFDQVIFEFASWSHFAIAHKGLIGRHETLTIDKSSTRYGLIG